MADPEYLYNYALSRYPDIDFELVLHIDDRVMAREVNQMDLDLFT